MQIAFVSYNGLSRFAGGDRLAADALVRRGAVVDHHAWDNPQIVWEQYTAVIVRSCWDYHLRAAEFDAWLDRLQQRRAVLWNPADVLRWNIDKIYLRDLQARGIAIPPTCWIERGATADLQELLREQGWERAVIKPRISATAHETWVTTRADAEQAAARFQAQVRQSGVLVQQFVEEVVADGELSLIFFGNAYSHAVLKRAAPGDFRVQDDFGGTVEVVTPDTRVVAEAQRIVEAVGRSLLYTRVDGVVVAGRFLLMELELIEPYLFFEIDSQAPERFADLLEQYSDRAVKE